MMMMFIDDDDCHAKNMVDSLSIRFFLVVSTERKHLHMAFVAIVMDNAY